MISQIFAALIRIVSIVIVVMGLYKLTDNFISLYMAFDNNKITQFSYVIIFLFPFLVAVTLWFFSEKIATKLLQNVDCSNKLADTKTNEIQSFIIISTIGIVFFVITLDSLLTKFMPLLHDRFFKIHNYEALYIVAGIGSFNVLIALWLIFRSRSIVRKINRHNI